MRTVLLAMIAATLSIAAGCGDEPSGMYLGPVDGGPQPCNGNSIPHLKDKEISAFASFLVAGADGPLPEALSAYEAYAVVPGSKEEFGGGLMIRGSRPGAYVIVMPPGYRTRIACAEVNTIQAHADPDRPNTRKLINNHGAAMWLVEEESGPVLRFGHSKAGHRRHTSDATLRRLDAPTSSD